MGSNAERRKMHLVRLDLLTRPKKQGGWGLLDLKLFGTALLCKTLWRGIFGTSPWSDIIRQKYQLGRDIEFWFRLHSIGLQHGFAIWLSFRRIQHYFLSNLKWQIHSGRKVLMGIDSFAGFRGLSSVPSSIIFHLHRAGLFSWDRVIKDWKGPSPVLMDAPDVGIPLDLSPQWDILKTSLLQGGIARSADDGSLSPSSSHAIVKDIYMDLITLSNRLISKRFPALWWNLGYPSK